MAASERRPNLLLIMADQHRYDWYGAAGGAPLGARARMPNLDRLAASGMRFPQTVCNSPLCAPSRISLATGLQPHRLGTLTNQAFLPPGTPTYYQALRDSGYRVGFVGKLDLHKPDPFNGRDGNLPITYSYGFTDPVECEGKMHAGTGWDWATGQPRPHGPYNRYLLSRDKLQAFCDDYRLRARQRPVWYAADSVLSLEECEDSYIGRRACSFIERAPEESPWHLFVSFVGPHDPWDPPTELAERFRNAPMPEPIADAMEGKPNWIRHKSAAQAGATPEEVAIVRRQYTAWLELIDLQIGALLAAVKQRGQLDNTYVFYTSDHGEMLGDHGLYQKSAPYEPSVRVPLVAAGPGVPAAINDALVELSDLHPTLLELASVRPRPGMDARSFASLLTETSGEHRADTMSQLYNFRLLRTQRYKYIESYNDLPELYDLQADPNELRNLANVQPEMVEEFRRRLMVRMR